MEPRTQLPETHDPDPRERPQRRREWHGIFRSVVLPLAILAAIVGGLWYWDSRDEDGSSETGSPFGVVDLPADRNAADKSPAAAVGRAAPDFFLERPEGGTLRLSDLQGRPVVLNFWATWCPPCREEMPELVAAYARHSGHGLVIVGIDLQEPDDMVLDFAAEFGIAFPLVIDRTGKVADAWRLGGPIEGIPTSYFLDSSGVIRALFYGPMTEESLEERLTKILPDEAN